ncbi:MAG: EAL domain-containing protein [Sulfuricella sp.]|nr:EAL domain-containing protein [Sulfuricella sp.]
MGQIKLLDHLADRLKAASLSEFLAVTIAASVMLAEAIVAAMSWLLHGRIAGDFMLTGTVAAVFVSGTVGLFLYHLIDQLRQAENLLMEKTLHLNQMLFTHQVAEKSLAQLAHYDALTTLPNRSLFTDRLDHALIRSARSSEMVAVMLLDIDNFKTVNDILGHQLGDVLLQEIAQRLRHCVLEDDTLARLGGDEFAVILEGISEIEEAADIAQKVVDAFAQPFVPDGREIFVTTSLGVSVYPLDGQDGVDLLKNADTAMYRAKESGRNHFRFYTADMNTLAVERFAMEGGLRRALERGEFLLHYQPQVEIRSGQMVGVEALLRWNHPERGLVPPNQFIPLLEENNLIVPVGEWVLRTACAQGRAWQEAGLPALRIGVNLSARQFSHGDLVETIGGVLRDTGLSPRLLELELTEGMLMENTKATSAILEQLKRKGVFIAIDDFGTGYSSLGYLKRFPIDRLKIDRSFVRDIITDPNDAAIAVAIISLGRSLGMNVIAEGVETQEQLEFLGVQKCDEYQGYYFSRAVPAEEIAYLLKSPSRAARCKIRPS